MPLWLGLDFGTSGAKALLVDETGRVRARASARYRTTFGPGGAAEQDPAAYLGAARELVAACSGGGRPDGIGIAGHSPSQVLVDDAGRALRPALTWQDVRAGLEARELAERLGDPVAILGTSIPWGAMYPAAKLLWLSRHEPDLAARARWILSPKDFVGFWLTGSPVSDPWSSRGMCNVATGAVALEALEAVGLSPSVVPELRAAWERRGLVTSEAATKSGLPAGIPVSVGWSDALAAVLAIGGFDRPVAFVITGTADVIGLSAPDVPANASPLFSVPRRCAPMPLIYGATQSSGAAIAWARDTLRPLVAADAPARGRPGRAGRLHAPPTFVPYLSGERAPVWRDDVRGLFVGLALEHSAEDLLHAVESGVACSGRDVLEAAEAVAGRRSEEVAIGGASVADRRALDVRRTVLGRRLTVMNESQASALGAAMLGAAAAGAPIERSAGALRGDSTHLEPTANQVRAGDVAFAAYLRARAIALEWADGERGS